MPVIKRITQDMVRSRFNAGDRLTDDDLAEVKDLWIARSGIAYYAGYYNHEESAKVLGYATIEACEIAGYMHISSCYNGKPQIVNTYAKYTSAQKNTLAYYCAIHGIKNPLE